MDKSANPLFPAMGGGTNMNCEMRMCGYHWVYCDGRCKYCTQTTTLTYNSTSTTEGGYYHGEKI